MPFIVAPFNVLLDLLKSLISRVMAGYVIFSPYLFFILLGELFST